MTTSLYKKDIIFVIIVLFIGASVIPSISGDLEEKIFDGNPLAFGWKHKTPVELESATPVDDYQVKIELDSSNFDYSKTNTDGSDIRFYDLHGNKLSYWIEKWNPDGTSVVWVKILVAGTSNVYLYSGNNEALGESNGDKTFVFFDDFENSSLDTDKWMKKYDPTVSVSNGELTLTDFYGDHSHLISTVSIPQGTRTRIKFKQEKNGPNLPHLQSVSLGDGIPPINDNNAIIVDDSARWNEWRFRTNCNGTWSGTKNIIGERNHFSYHTDDYIWDSDIVEYYFNDEFKARSSTVPYGKLNIKFNVIEFNTIICDWVLVTKLEEPEVIFSDDFDDNEPDIINWTEIYDDGFWNETNCRTEFKLYEKSAGVKEGIESREFNVSLSLNESVRITWDWNTNIGSTGKVGTINLMITNGTNWIKCYYATAKDFTIYQDSNDDIYKVLNPGKGSGSWNNEIQIFGDRYYVRMDNDNSTGWVDDVLFPPNATLKVQMFLDVTGDTPSAYMHASFDNIKVEMPVYGKQSPFPPHISGQTSGKPGETQDFTFYTIDPEGDDVYIYIEWGDNTTGDWIGPYPSGEWVTASHTWDEKGTYDIKALAVDIYGYESDWATLPVSIPRNKAINTPFLRFLENHPTMFPLLWQLLGLQ
jgi:hypothetical protein